MAQYTRCRRLWLMPHNDSQGTLLSLLTSKGGASFYQHWLLLRRLKGKGLIDPNRMEPFEEVFLTTKYLCQIPN
jgi:hypothetical protein